LGICVSLLAGETAGSSNRTRQFNSGNFRLADDLSHAYAIAEVVDTLKEAGIKWGTNSYLVQAISRCVWVDEFDVEVFKSKIKKFAFLFEKQATMRDYASIVEKVYNRGTQNKIPLVFLTEQKAREAAHKKGITESLS
jgi:hypothetical protein